MTQYKGSDWVRQNNWDNFNQAAGGQIGAADQYVQTFADTMQRLTGRAPNIDEINAFISGPGMSAAAAPGDISYSDLNNLASAYTQNTFANDVTGYQEKQQADSLSRQQEMIKKLVADQTGAATEQLTNPQTKSMLQGAYNGMGLASGGAFDAGVGNTLANAAAGNISSALGAFTLPALGNIQNLSGITYGGDSGQRYSGLGHLNDLQDFGLQSGLMRSLQEMMQPSGMDRAIGYTSSLLNAGGNAAKGGAAIGSTYICSELIRRGLLTRSDLDDLYAHIMPAMFKKGRALWHYAMNGQQLVNAANKVGVNWALLKPLFFDAVMDEPDAAMAVNKYAKACLILAYMSDIRLWDERVLRTSVWDSLKFLPRLFGYQPFRKLLGKCLRQKFLIIYDKPVGVHRVA
jgi:hypothetical protein